MKSTSESEIMTGKKILIVEDDVFTAKLLEKRLKALDYTVLAIVSSGEKAIEVIKTMNPNLILMDIMLDGDMDGVETAKQIRTFFNIPIIYLTAYSDDKILRRAVVTEPYGYIIKPFKDNELRTVIEIALYKHKIEKKLRESEELFRTVFETAQDFMFIKNLDLRYIRVNPAVANLFDIAVEELTGKTDIDFFSGEAGKHVREVDQRVLQGEIIEEEVTRPINGVMHALLITKVPLRDSEGNIIGLFGVARDITEHKRAEKVLKRAHDELESKVEERTRELRLLHEEKDSFISRASHDLRTPNAAILGFSELLIQGKWGNLNKEQLERVQKIANHALRLNRIVSDLLSISRIEAGVIGIAKDVVNISNEIKNVIAEMTATIKTKSQSIEFVDTTSPTKVTGDCDSIHQILTNLIDNSCTYNDEKGEITVTVDQHDSKCIVHVKDTGIGLTKEDQKHVFDEFYRAAREGEVLSQGTGLGLAIVKRLVTQMDGKVWVESEGLGKGSTFSFSIPISKK